MATTHITLSNRQGGADCFFYRNCSTILPIVHSLLDEMNTMEEYVTAAIWFWENRMEVCFFCHGREFTDHNSHDCVHHGQDDYRPLDAWLRDMLVPGAIKRYLAVLGRDVENHQHLISKWQGYKAA